MLEVGPIFNCENLYGYREDEVFAKTVDLAVESEQLGYDVVAVTEHHFTSTYSLSADPLQVLSYIGARTSSITLMSGAVILPWNDPVRVVEKAALLDVMTGGGRVNLGMGRGLARQEFEGFNIPLEESRERFDESARMIVDALDTGVIKSEGPFYPHTELDYRPKPMGSFKNRIYAIGSGSEESVLIAARLGVGLMMTLQKKVRSYDEIIAIYREAFEEAHGYAPPLPVCAAMPMFCHEKPGVARQMASPWTGMYFDTIMNHYGYNKPDNFKNTKGYESYTNGAFALASGMDKARATFAESGIYGTPSEVLEQSLELVDGIGDFRWLLAAGMPYDEMAESMRLFGQEVLPALHQHCNSSTPVSEDVPAGVGN